MATNLMSGGKMQLGLKVSKGGMFNVNSGKKAKSLINFKGFKGLF